MTERPKIKLEELKHGQGYIVMFMAAIIVALGVLSFGLGASRLLGVGDKPDTELVWQAKHLELMAQDYQGYLEEESETRYEASVGLMIFLPICCVLAYFLVYTAVSPKIKCPSGHVTWKPYSFCPDCGKKIYDSSELSPDEWQKRYPDGV